MSVRYNEYALAERGVLFRVAKRRVRAGHVEEAPLQCGLLAIELAEGSGDVGVQIELRPSAAVSTRRLRVWAIWATDRTLSAC